MKNIIIASLLVLLCGVAEARTASLAPNMSGSLSPSTAKQADNMTVDGVALGDKVWGVENGGTGSNINSVNQHPFPISSVASTIASVSNIAGTSRIIAGNPNVYSFATGTTGNYTVDSSFCNYSGGVPAVSSTGYLYGMVPSFGQSLGTYTIDCIVEASQMDLRIVANLYGSLEVLVDGVSIMNIQQNSDVTAQAGGNSTITLAASSSAVDGYYNRGYIYIVSGTGAGQRARVVSYNGSTKVATITQIAPTSSGTWTVNPDNTSHYAFSPSDNTYFNALQSTPYYPTLTFTGEIRPHLVTIISRQAFYLKEIAVDSYGVVKKPAVTPKQTAVIVADSFGAVIGGTTSAAGYGANSYLWPYQFCKNFGYNCQVQAVGGTGIIAEGGFMSFPQRTTPPVNSWNVGIGGATGGSFLLTQSGTSTSAIAWNASAADVQTALNAAFGANQWKVWLANGPYTPYKFIAENVGTATSSTSTLTIDGTSLTGTSIGTNFIVGTSQYVGDIAPIVPKDRSGNALPFTIVVQSSVNDISSYTTLQAAASAYYTALHVAFPTATIIATGIPMEKGPMSDVNVAHAIAAQQAIIAAATDSIPKINGAIALLPTYDSTTGVGYLNGTTNVATAAGAAGVNTDIMVGSDGVHPTFWGGVLLSTVFTEAYASLVRNTP